MRRAIASTAVLAVVLAGWARGDPGCSAPTACEAPARDTTYGTAVTWEDDGDAAARRASQEGKLLLVLHIAGDLPDDART